MQNIMTLSEFIRAVAEMAQKPVMAVQTDTSIASSFRFRQELNLPEEAIDTLQHEDSVFMIFETNDHAKQAFWTLCSDFPSAGQTTLAMFAHIALPDGKHASFEQAAGMETKINRDGMGDDHTFDDLVFD